MLFARFFTIFINDFIFACRVDILFRMNYHPPARALFAPPFTSVPPTGSVYFEQHTIWGLRDLGKGQIQR